MAATAYFYASDTNTGETSTANMIRMFCRPLSNGSGGPDPSPATQGAALATEINAASEETIWVFPSRLMSVLDNDGAAGCVSVADMLVNGPQTGLRKQRFLAMMTALRDGLNDGIVIDGLHFDEEPGYMGDTFGYYTLGGSSSARGTAMFNVLQDPVLRRFFPSYMWDLTEAQLQGFDTWDGTVGSRYAVDWDRVMIGKIWDRVRDFVSIFESVFGYVPATVCNYEDENLIRARKYSSGQPVGAAARSIANVSCPPMWLSGDTNAAYTTTAKPNWWNSLIWNLNWVRSLRGRIIPQISQPGYDGDANPVVTNYDLWDELLAHLGAMGIGEFIGFTYGAGSTPKGHMQSVLAGLDVATDAPARYDLIAYDADSITTNGVTTEYASSLGNGRVSS